MRASVIIPSYNAASTLPETIESILPQLTEQDEIIIVDDGSTDGTENCIRSYIGNRVRYIRQDNSGGPASPRNTGIKAAKGKYIFLFDSDDLMLPEKLERSIEALEEHPDAGILFTNFQTIDENGEVLKQRFIDDYAFIRNLTNVCSKTLHKVDVPDACIHLARENFIGTSSVAIPISIFKQVGRFDESLRNGDDRDMWFRITRNYPAVYLNQPFHSYRIRAGSISSGKETKRSQNKIKVLEKQLADPINKKFERDIKNLISSNYFFISYESLLENKDNNARQEVLMALKYRITVGNIVLLGKTLLGGRVLHYLRRLKKPT